MTILRQPKHQRQDHLQAIVVAPKEAGYVGWSRTNSKLDERRGSLSFIDYRLYFMTWIIYIYKSKLWFATCYWVGPNANSSPSCKGGCSASLAESRTMMGATPAVVWPVSIQKNMNSSVFETWCWNLFADSFSRYVYLKHFIKRMYIYFKDASYASKYMTWKRYVRFGWNLLLPHPKSGPAFLGFVGGPGPAGIAFEHRS